MNFVSFDKSLPRAAQVRASYRNPLSFGNAYLDKALGGIFADDLVIVTARTGGGKTELVTQIAMSNARTGKNVHYFALEAHAGEIECRAKFKMLAQAFFSQMDWRGYGDTPNYQEWLHNKQEGLVGKFEAEVDEILAKELSTLHVFYRDGAFDVTSFEGNMNKISRETDLVIVDHLHYFDFNSDNENLDLKRTVKQIKDVTAFYRKPTVLVVQLRKADKRTRGLLPDIEEIHGSSDVSKIATKIIATAPAKDQERREPHVFPTYFRVLKNRTDGSRCYYTALSGFDARRNTYSKDFILGELSSDDTGFKRIEGHEYPSWARH